jgi:Ca2+:H+ antiporter
MTIGTATETPWWAWVWPLLALLILGSQLLLSGNVLITAVEAFALIVTVFAAVYHAEVVAHEVGEPFGSLVLALAVTIIEVALIVSVMITGAGDSPANSQFGYLQGA